METYGFDMSEFTTDRQVHHRNVTLNPRHAYFETIRNRPDLAHLPEERFLQPIVRFWRCDMLVTFKELEEVVEASGAETSKEQLRKVPRILSDWRTGLQAYANEPGWDGELPGLAILSTGPHWELGRLKPITEEQMLFAYRKMVCGSNTI